MAEEESDSTRFTFPLDAELDRKMRDTALILGIKPTELAVRAVNKYIEAIELKAGEKFKTAMEAIQAIRDVS